VLDGAGCNNEQAPADHRVFEIVQKIVAGVPAGPLRDPL